MKKSRLTLYVIILVAIVLRLSTFFYDYVNIDETDYALAAQTILNGGIPYKDFLIYQPPVIYYIYALGFLLSGGTHLWAIHIITILFVVGTILALYSLTKELTKSEKGGLAAALAYAVYSTTFIPQDMLASNCEVLMMFPMTLAVLFLYRAIQNNKWHLYLLSGIMISLGVLAKYQGGILLIAALTYLLIWGQVLNLGTGTKLFPSGNNLVPVPKSRILPCFVLFIGFLIPLAIPTLYFYYSDALPQAIEAFTYIVLYAGGPAQSDPLYVFLKFIVRSIIFSLSSLPIWIGSFYVIYRVLKNRFRDPEMPQFTLGIILWFFLSILPIIMGGRIYFHYFYIILPPAAVLAGIWWAIRSEKMKPIFKYLIIGWMIICAVGWSTFSFYQASKGHGKKETWIGTAEYLKEIQRPGDTLFVWGLCYQLYFYSGMELGSRFTSADYLTGRSPMTAGLEYDPNMPNPPSSFEKLWNDFADKYHEVINFDTSHNIFPPAWKYLEDDFNKHLPTYIVDTSPSNYRRYTRYPTKDYPYLENVIRENYERVKEIDGYIVFHLRK